MGSTGSPFSMRRTFSTTCFGLNMGTRAVHDEHRYRGPQGDRLHVFAFLFLEFVQIVVGGAACGPARRSGASVRALGHQKAGGAVGGSRCAQCIKMYHF